MAHNHSNHSYDDERLVTTRDLVKIIGLSHQTQLTYMSNPRLRQRMPPGGFKRPGSREWLWKLGVVLKWRDSGKQAEQPIPLPRSSRRGLGRPPGSLNKKRRVEQIQAAKAGLQQGRA